jgi:hypothetical protein
MSLLPNLTYANLETPLWAVAGSGGGGSGSQVNTSSITVSTITGAGTFASFIAGATKLDYGWVVSVDGSSNSADVLVAPSTNTAYRDVAIALATGAEYQVLREEIALGSAQIGYITNPIAGATTGLRFISSLNGGPDATAVLTTTDRYPLGGQFIGLVPSVNLGDQDQKPLTSSFSTVVGHTYSLDIQIASESVTATPAGSDHLSYYVIGAGGNITVFNTILLSELSSITSVPAGRSLHGVFTASGTNAQVIAQMSQTLVSTNVQATTQGYAGMLVRDMGPTNLIIAP